MWQIIWNDEAAGNVDHVFEHGLTPDDVEFVLSNYESKDRSDTSGLPCVFGYIARRSRNHKERGKA